MAREYFSLLAKREYFEKPFPPCKRVSQHSLSRGFSDREQRIGINLWLPQPYQDFLYIIETVSFKTLYIHIGI